MAELSGESLFRALARESLLRFANHVTLLLLAPMAIFMLLVHAFAAEKLVSLVWAVAILAFLPYHVLVRLRRSAGELTEARTWVRAAREQRTSTAVSPEPDPTLSRRILSQLGWSRIGVALALVVGLAAYGMAVTLGWVPGAGSTAWRDVVVLFLLVTVVTLGARGAGLEWIAGDEDLDDDDEDDDDEDDEDDEDDDESWASLTWSFLKLLVGFSLAFLAPIMIPVLGVMALKAEDPTRPLIAAAILAVLALLARRWFSGGAADDDDEGDDDGGEA